MIQTKICNKCRLEKSLDNFYFRKDTNDYRKECIDCMKLRWKKRYLKEAKKFKYKSRLYNKNNKEKIYKRKIKKHKKEPWIRIFHDIKQRCNNINCKSYKYYGAREIKCLITIEELKELWFKDKAYEMKKPSIDRINNDGNYEYSNCQFIEQTNNSIKANNIKVLQYDVNENFIREWNSIKEASIKMNISQVGISLVLTKENRKTAGGFIWRYK